MMKTLDEVINKLECYPVSPSTLPCSVSIVTVEDLDDALHYLRDYRMLVDDIAAKRKELEDEKARYQKIEDEYEELKDWWAEEHAENVPLTFDELKTMLGKPVWFVYDWNNVHYKGWILLDHLEGIFIIDAKDEWALSEVNMDNWNNWKAYRKEKQFVINLCISFTFITN